MADCGEILRKVTLEIYLDLRQLINGLKKHDAEVRTSLVKMFVARSKMKLTQLYLLTRWLSGKNVSTFFHQTREGDGQSLLLNNGLSMKLDELFFSHSAVYSMRTEPLRLSLGGNCLVDGGLHDIPSSVFLLGNTTLSKRQIASISSSDIDMYIRIKLLLSNFSESSLTLSVSNGYLLIRSENFFEIYVTILHLEVSAPWTLLGLKLLVKLGDRGESTLPQSKPLEEALFETCGRILSGGEEGSLARVLSLCRHCALGAAVQVLNLHAKKLAVGAWKSVMEVEWEVREVSSVLSLKFWKSTFTRDFLLTLRIGHKRSLAAAADVDDVGLECSLIVAGSRSAAKRFESVLQIDKYLREGVRFESLFQDCLFLCSEAKIRLTSARISASLASLSALNFAVKVSGSSLRVFRTADDLQLGFVLEVDSRSGKIVVSSTAEVGSLQADWKSFVDVFLLEVNSVESEQLFSAFVETAAWTEDEQSSGNVSPLKTLEAVLACLDLSWWSQHLSTHLLRVGRGAALSKIVDPSVDRTLTFDVTSWFTAKAVLARCAHNYNALFQRGSSLANVVANHATGDEVKPAVLVVSTTLGPDDNLRVTASIGGDVETSCVSLKCVGSSPTSVGLMICGLLERHAMESQLCFGASSASCENTSGYMLHNEDSVTVVQSHRQHTYLAYCSKGAESVMVNGGGDFVACESFQACDSSAVVCELRLLSCASEGLVLEALKCDGDLHFEVFFTELLQLSLRQYLRTGAGRSAAGWWREVQPLMETVFLLFRACCSDLQVKPVHQSVTDKCIRAVLSVGRSLGATIDGYLELSLLSSAGLGVEGNEVAVSVRNMTAVVAPALHSRTSDVRLEVEKLLTEFREGS